jgi:hypothetical protein
MNYLHAEAPVKVIHRDLKSKNGKWICKYFVKTWCKNACLRSERVTTLFNMLLCFVYRILVVVTKDLICKVIAYYINCNLICYVITKINWMTNYMNQFSKCKEKTLLLLL